MADIITRVIVDDRLEIRANIPFEGGEAKKYKFKTKFRVGRELAAGDKNVVVSVIFAGSDSETGPFPVEAVLADPDGKIVEGPIILENRGDQSLVPPLGGIPIALFAVNTDSDSSGETPPPPSLDQLTHTITDDDPDGEWTVTLKNVGSQTGVFRILMAHPGKHLKLATSEIPLSLLNRFLDKIKRLMSLRVRLDRTLTISFSEEFRDLTGLENQEFGEDIKITIEKGHPPFSIKKDVRFRDITLEDLQVAIEARGGKTVFHAAAKFETGGREELDIKIASDIDIKKAEFGLDVTLRREINAPVYTERRDFIGNKVINPPDDRVGMDIVLNPDLVLEDVLLDAIPDSLFDIEEEVKKSFQEELGNPTTHNKLLVVAEHFTDALMFLATGDLDQAFFDITANNHSIVVTHYRKPSSQLSFLDDLPFGPGDEVEAETTSGTAAPAISSSTGNFATAGIFPLGAVGSGPTADTVEETEPEVGSGRKIDHIVVLMMENRSFDHMLGYLRFQKDQDGKIRDDIDGLLGPTVNKNLVPGSDVPQPIHELDSELNVDDPDAGTIEVDPSHSASAVLEQIAGGEMSGFVANYQKKAAPGDEDLVMGFYNKRFLPIYDVLSKEYRICNRWFCSHPGPTYPNRFISLMGSTPDINNIKLGGEQAGALRGDNIFDILTRERVSWKYVEGNIAFLRMFDKYRLDEENIIQHKDFMRRAEEGHLPSVTWIDPNFGELEIDNAANDDHPPADVRNGQKLVRDIYEALTKNPKQWEKTLFIITYDEHGGFYDHVPPHGLNGTEEPVVHKIHEDSQNFFGLRVPTFLISPWISARTVSNTVFDHTSILKTILLNFIGPEATQKELLGKRVDAANDLLSELGETKRSDVPVLPEPPSGSNRSARSLPADRFDPQSFHLSMRLFPFGFKIKQMRPE